MFLTAWGLFYCAETKGMARATYFSMEGFSKTRGVRRDSLGALEPVLRVYEGCAGALLGEVEGANVLKLHRYSGKVTYLVCPGLDNDPDPTLELRVKVTLPTLAIDVFDYTQRNDPPRLGVEPGLLSRRE
jgi:DNA phosphorothioation-associated putative methyltransferase